MLCSGCLIPMCSGDSFYLCAWGVGIIFVGRLFAEQQQVLELTRLAGLDIREDVLVILLELMKCDAPPTLVLQVLRSLAGVTESSPPPTLSSAKPSSFSRHT